MQINQIQPSDFLYDQERKVYVTIRTIYPDVAKQLLEGRSKNRSISPSVVARYKKFMTQGEWVLNGEPIIFAENKLIDGQHRLSACVDADTPFDALWVELGDSEVFKTLNQGRRRSGSDVLAIGGHKFATALYSSMCILGKIDSTGKLGWQGMGSSVRVDVANHEVEEFASKYPHLEASCRKCCVWAKNFRLPRAPMIALHYLLRRAESKTIPMSEESAHSKADEFMEGLCKGINLVPGHPIIPIRNKLIEQMTQRVRISPHFIVRGGVLAWNAWTEGRPVAKINVGKNTLIPKVKRYLRGSNNDKIYPS